MLTTGETQHAARRVIVKRLIFGFEKASDFHAERWPTSDKWTCGMPLHGDFDDPNGLCRSIRFLNGTKPSSVLARHGESVTRHYETSPGIIKLRQAL